MYDHTDPTAWIAIANTERERKQKEWLAAHPPQTKTEHPHAPAPPVDWHKVLASKNKKIHINRAWLFYAEMERQINERNKGISNSSDIQRGEVSRKMPGEAESADTERD